MRFAFSSFFFVCLLGVSAHASKSQFQEHLALVNSPSPKFDDFIAQLHEAGLAFEREPFINTFEVTVPRGRSLQKDTTRELRALTFSRGATFIGYAPKTDEGEVISWNPSVGDFEFLQFTGLKKKKLVVRAANRNFCLGCHQGASPIFPRAPWSEMTEEAAFKKFGVKDADLAKLDPATREKKRFFTTAFFDSAVRKARLDLQKRTACRQMCGTDPVCRARLFQSAVQADEPRDRRIELELAIDAIQKGRPLPKMTHETSQKKARIANLEKSFAKTWPEHGFALPSSTLLDRSSVATAPGFKLVGRMNNGEDPNFSESFSFLAIGRGPVVGDPDRDAIRDHHLKEFAVEGRMTEVALSATEKTLADPKSTRPLVGAIPKDAAARWADLIAPDCFEPSAEVKALAEMKAKSLEKALEHPAVVAAFCRWPASETEVASLVRDVASGKIESASGPVVCSAIASAAIAPPAEVKSLDLLPARGGFRKYCSECHGKGTDIPLALDDLEFLKSYRGVYEPSVKRALETGAMPPKTAPQPSEKEIREMIKVLGG